MKYLLQFLTYLKKGFWCTALGFIVWLFTSFSQSFLRFWPTVSNWMDFYLRNHDGTTTNVRYLLVQNLSLITAKLEILLSQLNYWIPLADIFNNFVGLVGFCLYAWVLKIVVSFALKRG